MNGHKLIGECVQLSVIIKTPRETDFLMDIPLTCSWMTYSLAGLHDISPLKLYTNFTRLDMEQLELPEFDYYKTFDRKFTPSWTGTEPTFCHSSRSSLPVGLLVTIRLNQWIRNSMISVHFIRAENN